MSNVIDMTGLQIGRWRVIKQAPSDKGGQAMWVCQCACSNNTISVVRGADLRSGKSLSCGCLHNELLSDIRSTHKKTSTRLYVIWKNMRQRCYNSNHPAYKNYGGRGVDDTLSLSEWCKKLGKVYGTVRSRINKLHWSPEEALEIVGRGDVV